MLLRAAVYLFLPSLVLSLQCFPSNPCVNGGKCRFSHGVGSCECPAQYVGEFCQYQNPCYPHSQCQNQGTCSVQINPVSGATFLCHCPVGYTASLCEIQIPNACNSNPCRHGGTCTLTDLENYTCHCPSGFTGPTCEEIDHCSSRPCRNGASCRSTDHSYVCTCAEGFRGPTCLEDVDECKLTNPCHRGTCLNLHGSYRCNCPEGFTGKNCESEYVPCSPSPCENNAKCIKWGVYKYHCDCPHGFTGRHCEVNINDCVPGRCQNGGKCIDSVGGYTCECTESWTGEHCEKDVDECSTKGLCRNGGTCVNSKGSYHCICVNGWEGKNCELNKDDCSGAVCYNGGTCHDGIAKFTCECPPGKTGLLCHLEDACVSNPCYDGSICNTNPVDGSYKCDCPDGLRGTRCDIDVDECFEEGDLCEHKGTCVNTPGSYRCDCTQGWEGKWCENNINECASQPCQNEATCLDDVGRFLCVCMPGFTGIHCETDIDECAAQATPPCLNNGICSDQINGYKCVCPVGFSGKRCETNEQDCRHGLCRNGGHCVDQVHGYTCQCAPGFTGTHCEHNENDCKSNPCKNGICIDEHRGFSCQCDPGYEGTLCDVRVDYCKSKPCQYNGTCIPLPSGGYQCICPAGTGGPDCSTNHNDCASNPCFNGAKCIDKVNDYVCECLKGYVGIRCQTEMDECASNPCANGGVCKDLIGRFECECPRGFYGRQCKALLNECASQPCNNGGVCEDDIDGFVCRCTHGWGGITCSDNVNECASNPCQHGGVCFDELGKFTCQCADGYTGDMCQTNVDDCASSVCQHNGTCIDGVNGFTCHCQVPYTGDRCQFEKNPCDVTNLCRNGAQCLPSNDFNSYTCHCPKGFTGHLCHEDVNECDVYPCRNGATCRNLVGSYQCQCPFGYTGRNCEMDTDECASAPCLNGGSCIDGMNTYRCECPEGYGGDHCESDLDECASKPCQNGATCYDYVNSYMCSCVPGFSGRNCEKNDQDCQKGLCLNGGTCIDGVNSYRCSCPKSYSGKNCQEHVNVDLYSDTDDFEYRQCVMNGCEAKGNNGVCDKDCNYFKCQWDGGDCSLGLNPFGNCSEPSYCSHVYGDSKCDSICNNEDCLFDGFDCGDRTEHEECRPTHHSQEYCIARYADGKCDRECNNAGCSFDGGDCSMPQHVEILHGDVVMILLSAPQVFIQQAERFLMEISKLIHANVRIKRDGKGQPMVYAWDSVNGMDPNPVPVPKDSSLQSVTVAAPAHQQRFRRALNEDGAQVQHSAAASGRVSGTLVALTIDITECVQTGRQDCFSDVCRVASYLAAANAKQELQQLGFPVYSAYGEVPPAQEAASHTWMGYVTGVIGVLVALLLVVMVLKRKRTIKAPTWFPTDFQTKSSRTSLDQTSICGKESIYGGIYPGGSAAPNNYEADMFSMKQHNLSMRKQPIGQEDTNHMAYLDNFGQPYGYQQACADTAVYCNPAKKARTDSDYATVESVKKTWAQAHKDVAKGVFDTNTAQTINAKGPDSQTPLHQSIVIGRVSEEAQNKVVKDVLNLGADPNAVTDTRKETALIMACRLMRPKPVETMLSYKDVDPSECDINGNTALHHAVMVNSLELVEILLHHHKVVENVDAKNENEMSPLVAWSSLGFMDSVELPKRLIEKGASISAVDKDGLSAMHWAAFTNNLSLMELLMSRGANKDAQDSRDQTPLYMAAKQGHCQAIQFLIEHGASKDITDQMDRLPIHIAKEGYWDKAVALLDSLSCTPMQYAQAGTSTLPRSMHGNAKPKAKRTKSLRDGQKGRPKQVIASHKVVSPHSTMSGIVSPPSSGGVPVHLGSPYSNGSGSMGGINTPSPHSMQMMQHTAHQQQSCAMNAAPSCSRVDYTQSSCMLSPPYTANSGSPPTAACPGAPYRSPPPYSNACAGGQAAYHHKSPLNYAQSPPEQFTQLQGVQACDPNVQYWLDSTQLPVEMNSHYQTSNLAPSALHQEYNLSDMNPHQTMVYDAQYANTNDPYSVPNQQYAYNYHPQC